MSVELEKTYSGIEKLGYMADVIFVSKEFSHKMGQKTPEAMVKEFRSHIRGDAILICPWGSKGAVASTKTEVFSRYVRTTCSYCSYSAVPLMFPEVL